MPRCSPRSLDTGWIHAIRKWTLVSWLFLSIGITLGMWWAYVELGWGGYWAWDPVENASLLPWLTMTAFLHSVMIQEKRGMLKRWNLGLIIGTFLLSIFGTFITRSGRDRERAQLHPVERGVLLPRLPGGLRRSSRSRCSTPAGRRSRPEVQLESVVSREAAFLFNNLLLVGIAFSVLWGTLFPILSELVRGSKITVGPPFFNRVNVPLGLLLLAPHRHRPADRLAQGVDRQPQAAVHRAGRQRAGHRSSPCSPRASATSIALDGAGPGRLRGRHHRAGVLSGRARAAADARGVGSRSPSARLVARNRRRYGGYLVHVGVLIYFVAFAGMAFKRERRRPSSRASRRS